MTRTTQRSRGRTSARIGARSAAPSSTGIARSRARARAGRRHRGAYARCRRGRAGCTPRPRARPSVSRMSASSSTTRMSRPDMGGRSGGVARGIVTRAAYPSARASRAGARRPSRPAGARRHGGGRCHPVRGRRASRTGTIQSKIASATCPSGPRSRRARSPRRGARGSRPRRSPPPPRRSCSRPRDRSASPSAFARSR